MNILIVVNFGVRSFVGNLTFGRKLAHWEHARSLKHSKEYQ
jgi:hypothetical protein